MKPGNQTTVTHFLLWGFGLHGKMKLLFSIVISVMFLATMIGNSLIVGITAIDSALHTPMYYFLKNLALTEICYSLSIVPKMLLILLGRENYFLHSLCLATQLCYTFCHLWVLSLRCNGLWPTSGNMPPSALWHHDEQGPLLQDGCWVLALWDTCCSGLPHMAVYPALLWEKQGRSFLLWCFSRVEPGVCRHSFVWTTDCYGYSHDSDDPLFTDHYFLPSHYSCCSSDTLGCGSEAGLFHMCSSPGSSNFFLQHNRHHSRAS